MRVLCLWFPHLGAALAVQQRPALRGRPFVILSGHGADALVAASSCDASAAGVLPGMTAGQVRALAPGAVSLPDNAVACLAELDRLAALLRRRVPGAVAAGGRDRLNIANESGTDEELFAARAAGLVRAWSGHDLRAGIGASPKAALEAARFARSGPVVAPEGATDEPGAPIRPLDTEVITASACVREGAIEGTARRVLARLDAILSAYDASYRRIAVEAETPGGIRGAALRFPVPLHAASEAADAISRALSAEALHDASGLTIRLEGLGPSVRVEPSVAAPRRIRDAYRPRQGVLLRRAG